MIIKRMLTVVLFIIGFIPVYADSIPVAVPGPSRYVCHDPVTLDGSQSYDPGNRPLTYEWKRVSGPAVSIADADTAAPTVSGFAPGDDLQVCRLQLVVHNQQQASAPAFVDIYIVPDFGTDTLELLNPPFRPGLPTIISLGGGNCHCGMTMPFDSTPVWYENVNFLTTEYCEPYSQVANMLMVYLSSRAPGYNQPIQAIGFSTGCNIAITIGNYINQTYNDPRFAINRVTLLDPVCGGWDFPKLVETFQANPVADEMAWVDVYSNSAVFIPNALWVDFPEGDHFSPYYWYLGSALTASWPDGDMFNNGITGGYYVSVAGPGKNMNLATGDTYYNYTRILDSSPLGFLGFRNYARYPGRLPQAAQLVGPADSAVVGQKGALMSCRPSENAVQYELLIGTHPVKPGEPVSVSPHPPAPVVSGFASDPVYWTVRAQDVYGTSVYADPRALITTPQASPVSLSILEPVSGTAVSGSVLILVQVSSGNNSAGYPPVSIYIDDEVRHVDMQAQGPVSFLWETGTEMNGYHDIRVMATDNTGNNTSVRSRIRVENLTLEIAGERLNDRAWVIRSHFARLELTINKNDTSVPVQKYVIYRKPVSGAYTAVEEIPETGAANNPVVFMDTTVHTDEWYIYKVEAQDGSGRVLAVSDTLVL